MLTKSRRLRTSGFLPASLPAAEKLAGNGSQSALKAAQKAAKRC
jgi:hypothetical protein